MTRIIRVISLLLTVVIVSAACVTDTTEAVPDYDFSPVSDIDMLGYECDISQGYDLDHPFQYPRNTLMADMYLKRLDEISKDWNCKVTLRADFAGGYLEGSIAYIYSGLHAGEIACTHQPSNIARAGVLYPLEGLRDRLDYMNADKFGSLGLLEMGMVNGVPYTVSPVAWPGKQSSYSYNIFAVNEDLVSKYGKTDPRDYVENGEWTWETFSNVIPDYQIEEGSFTATAVNGGVFVREAAFMNGANFFEIDGSGRPVSALDSQNIAEAIDWCARLYTEDKDYISFLGFYEMVDAFINGKVVLANTSFTHMINEMIYDVDNYGVVPFPCGPRGTYGQWRTAFSDFDSMGIFVNAKDPESAAMIIDRLFEPFEGYETEESLAQYASNIFYDSREVEIFITYLKYTRWNYWTVGLDEYFSNLDSMARLGRSSAEAIETYKGAADVILEKYVFPNYEFISQYQDGSK